MTSIFDWFRRDRRSVLYDDDGRQGWVWYCDGTTRVRFAREFGGGDCVAIVYVSAPEVWEKETGLPLARRDEVLEFTAQCVLRDQLPQGGRVQIETDALTFFQK